MAKAVAVSSVLLRDRGKRKETQEPAQQPERVTIPAKRARAESTAAIPAASGNAAVSQAAAAAPAGEPPLVLEDLPEDSSRGLVITIAPSGWELSSSEAIVGARAQRVAIAPGRGPDGTLVVRPLVAGEVAPGGSVVAILVALDPTAPKSLKS